MKKQIKILAKGRHVSRKLLVLVYQNVNLKVSNIFYTIIKLIIRTFELLFSHIV